MGKTDALSLVDAATRLMNQGDYAGAARQAKRAMQSGPSGPLLDVLVGALLLRTGDRAGALAHFRVAVNDGPDDSLARYGLALAQLSTGGIRESLDSLDRSERSGGDLSYLHIARRYAQWLEGAQVDVGDLGVPEPLVSGQQCLQGMALARRGDWRGAVQELTAGLKALPGDEILEPSGLLMAYDATQPLATAASALAGGLSLGVVDVPGAALSGDVQFTPEDTSLDVAYVAYELDGQSLSLVNIRPFQYVWNSRQVSNGPHDLTIIQYNAGTHEIGRSTRRIRVLNAATPGAVPATDAQADEARAALWQALALRPERAACAYQIGLAERALGDVPAARLWFTRALAVNPDYRDARRQWLACGGVGGAGPAMYGGTASEKVVALTFDDGPKPGVTEPLLDILKEQGVPATFFVIGRHVIEYPDLTRKIVDAGMEIANHSYTHRNLTKLSPTVVAREILETQAAVESVTGKAPRYLRPPGGDWNGAVAAITRDWGLTPCFWTVDVYGSEVIGAQQVADAVVQQVRPGSIVLMHNGKMSTLQALPTIIRVLKARGYGFVTVETLEQRLISARALAGARGAQPHRVE